MDDKEIQARELVAGLAQKLGLETLMADDEDLAVLEYEDAPVISLSVDEDEQRLTLSVYLGDAPSGDQALLEELLSANWNWQDTEGATLSLDLDSRGIYLARRWATAELRDVQGMSDALQQFISVAQRWASVVEQLRSDRRA